MAKKQKAEHIVKRLGLSIATQDLFRVFAVNGENQSERVGYITYISIAKEPADRNVCLKEIHEHFEFGNRLDIDHLDLFYYSFLGEEFKITSWIIQTKK